MGVRDSNPDCCSHVYSDTGRKAIYLPDLKLAPRSHQWDLVRPLYSDSAFKNFYPSDKYLQFLNLSANGSRIGERPRLKEIYSWQEGEVEGKRAGFNKSLSGYKN